MVTPNGGKDRIVSNSLSFSDPAGGPHAGGPHAPELKYISILDRFSKTDLFSKFSSSLQVLFSASS